MRYLLLIVATLFCFCGCSTQQDGLQNWTQAPSNGKIKILSTTAMIDDLVKEIGGDSISSIVLIRGELDPHSYQLVKGDDEKLAMADIVFCSGLGLEHGPSLRSALATYPHVVCLGDRIRENVPELILYQKKTPDPHVWMDMSLWARGIPAIVEALSAKNPADADLYRQRGETLAKNMELEHARLQEEMSELAEEKRYLVTSHDAFNYFTRAYLATPAERTAGNWHHRFAAPEGLAPESQLSTSDIRQILQHMKIYHIHVLFPESNVSQASIRKLLDAGNEQGMKLVIAPGPLFGDAMGPPGSPADTYFKMIAHNVQTIKQQINQSGPPSNGH